MLLSRMARPIDLWLPSVILFALSACGGSESGFFSDVPFAGSGNANRAGASSSGGSPSTSGAGGSAGADSDSVIAGTSNSGGQAGGSSASGSSPGGATSGGGESRAGAGGSGAAAGRGAGMAGSAQGGSAQGGSAQGGSAQGGSAQAGSTQQSTCSELLKLANQQLEAARECNLDVDALQCTGKVTNPCGCQVPVHRTDSAESKAYLKTLNQLEDKDCAIACTAVACTSVNNAQCRSSSSSAKGTCVATSHDSTR
jgi:hypothetical protein